MSDRIKEIRNHGKWLKYSMDTAENMGRKDVANARNIQAAVSKNVTTQTPIKNRAGEVLDVQTVDGGSVGVICS
ncbi:hypothetical protein BH20VER1_BH20VER1_08160 [soil metagenome]